MNIRELYEIRLGNYKDKYMVTHIFFMPNGKHSADLRRVQRPKTKIDGVRLPETISITFFGSPIPNPVEPTKRKKNSTTKA